MPMPDDAELARMIHRAQLEEANNTGPTLTPRAGPWRYPYWPKHDVAWEDE
jgi:hypothetical protein